MEKIEEEQDQKNEEELIKVKSMVLFNNTDDLLLKGQNQNTEFDQQVE